MNKTSNYMESVGKYTKWLFIILIAFSFVSLSSCKKEEEWEWCQDCTVDSLVGDYSGLATIHVDQGPDEPYLEIKDQEISIYIEEAHDQIRVTAQIRGVFTQSYFISYSDTYYLTYGDSFNATIWKSDDQFKLVGVIKYGDVTLYYQVIEFVVYKVG